LKSLSEAQDRPNEGLTLIAPSQPKRRYGSDNPEDIMRKRGDDLAL